MLWLVWTHAGCTTGDTGGEKLEFRECRQAERIAWPTLSRPPLEIRAIWLRCAHVVHMKTAIGFAVLITDLVEPGANCRPVSAYNYFARPALPSPSCARSDSHLHSTTVERCGLLKTNCAHLVPTAMQPVPQTVSTTTTGSTTLLRNWQMQIPNRASHLRTPNDSRLSDDIQRPIRATEIGIYGRHRRLSTNSGASRTTGEKVGI